MKQKPSPKVLWSWLALIVAITLPLTLLGSRVLLRLPTPLRWPITAIWGVCIVISLAAYLPLRLRNMSFCLEGDRISTTGGVWIRITRRMHRDAVRQVTLIEGPIERLCHTAFLLIRSTGGFMLIEGVDRDTADAWCGQLCHR